MSHEGMHTYPQTRVVDGQEITLRYMAPADKAGMLAFARAMPEHDLLFLRRDITEDSAVDGWLADIAGGLVTTLLAEAGGGSLATPLSTRTNCAGKRTWPSYAS